MAWNAEVKCIRCANNGHLIVGKIYKIKDGILTTEKGDKYNYKDINDINKHSLVNYFKEVKPDKLKLLLKDETVVSIGNTKYRLYLFSEHNLLEVIKNDNLEHAIRWGEKFNTTLSDIQPILDIFNIEIVEVLPKYKIDIEGEYSEEELEVLKSAGIKFKLVIKC